MASAFTAQLRSIAANSSNELNLKARRNAHAVSLIFERDVAVKQDWDTIFQICLEGFRELCVLDGRFQEFEQNLFSAQSKDQDRDQLNRAQNEELDAVIERCLSALSARIMLRPGVRAIEWLVRRFRIHVHNADAMLSAFLPYHENPIFRNVLSIIPAENIVGDWKFLSPYHKTASNPPRHAVIYTATNHDGFFSKLNNYVIRTCQDGYSYQGLMRFWSSVVVEAIAARLDQAKNGRKEIQRQRTEDVLLKVLPLLNDGLQMRGCPDMTLASYAILIVVAGTTSLDEKVLASLMEAVSTTIGNEETDLKSAIVCLTILSTQDHDVVAPRGVVMRFATIADLEARLGELKGQYNVTNLIGALIRGSLVIIKKKNASVLVDLMERLLRIATESKEVTKWLILLAVKIQQLDTEDLNEEQLRSQLVTFLQTLNDSGELSVAFSEAALIGSDIDVDLEAILGSTVIPLQLPAPVDLESLEVDEADTIQIELQSALEAIPSSTEQQSFFQNSATSLYGQVASVFRACVQSRANIDLFEKLSLWTSVSNNLTLLASFLLRIACGPNTVVERSSALRLLTKCLEDQTDLDTQFLLPYITYLLADSAQPVRQMATTVMLAMGKCAPTSLVDGEECSRLGSDSFYDPEVQETISTFSSNQLTKIIQQVYSPRLEECVLDASQIEKVLQNVLGGSISGTIASPKALNIDLKKSLRNHLFESLTSHAVVTPILRMKIGIIQLLENVHKVGSLSRSKALGPIIQSWLDLDYESALKAVGEENLQLSAFNSTLTQLFSTQEKDSISRILTILTIEKIKTRSDLAETLFARLVKLWNDARVETQTSAASQLFEMTSSADTTLAQEARMVLQNVSLSTPVLKALLQLSHSGLAQMQTEGPPKKRRRTSHGRDYLPPEISSELNSAASRIAFALELTENSKPEEHPELLQDLFDILVILRRLKDHHRSESPYLHNICLTSILAIIEKARTLRKPNVDLSSIRADLVTDSVRTSENPMVQTSAIQLSASLAAIAPDRMLHNIMPIFTFMGHNILSKEDDHTVHVVNQAIDQIIPPLVNSLKKQGETSLMKSTASLLSSFVAAYDHVPQHRKINFYNRLLSSLGPLDFSFALLAMLALRNPTDSSTKAFSSNLLAGFSPATQLVAYHKIIQLTDDIYEGEYRNTEPLLNINQNSTSEEKNEVILILFSIAEHLLRSKSLKSDGRKVRKLNTLESDEVREQYQICLYQILQTIRKRRQGDEEVLNLVRKCLSGLLELPSILNLLQILPEVLSEMDSRGEQDLKPQALRVLVLQLGKQPSKDKETQAAGIDFLQYLEKVLQSVEDASQKQIAIGCIDKIAEVYGRKDVDAVVSAANVVASEYGLGSSDVRVQVMSLLCLASMLEIVGEAAVPIIPEAMPKASALLENSLQVDAENVELHNAVFAFFSAVLSQVPFMISEEYLDQILEQSAESASSDLDNTALESRKDTLTLVASKIDLELLTSSLNKNWKTVVENDVDAVLSSLDILIDSIESHSKSNVIRSADQVSNFILQAFDLRRLQSLEDNDDFSEEEISQCEQKLNDMGIKFIYKLNDTIFRPIFESWVEWAVQCHDITESSDGAKVLRQTSLFNFLGHFFENLKSIVTSYSGYIIEPANKILKQTVDLVATKKSSVNAEQITLYNSLLSALTAAFNHDADSFFAAPSHFSTLSENLIAQLKLAIQKSTRPIVDSKVFPAIVALATATVDAPTLHHSLNHHICQLRHHDSAAVRLASIRVQLALTESDDIGEDWVNNVVGTGAEGGGGSGETMLYVNEMLEDDDEAVEAEVRRWVRLVRQQLGEDVFEL